MTRTTQKNFITAGQPIGIIGGGDGRCHREGDALVVLPDEHWGNPVFANASVDAGNFHLHAKLSIDRLVGDGASILLGGEYAEHWTRPEGSHTLRICLDEDSDPALKSMNKPMHIVYGITHPRRSWFPSDGVSDKKIAGVCSNFFRPAEPFTVDIVRRGADLTLTIDGREVFSTQADKLGLPDAGSPITIGFMPGRGTLRIHEFHAEGILPEPATPTTDLWQLNTDGYSSYRFPAVCVTATGRMLAFAEARRSYLSRGLEWEQIQEIEILSGDYHCAMKYSDDSGKTWSEQEIIVDRASMFDARYPSPLAVKESGETFLFIHGAWLLASSDNGQSWSEPRKLNGALPGNWRSGNRKSPLPGTANSTIQLRHGQFKGRLLAAFHVNGIIALMLSDDHGHTWQPGALAAVDMASNPSIVELSDGRILVCPQIKPRAGIQLPGRPLLPSLDGGSTFAATHYDPALPITRHATLLSIDLTNADTTENTHALLFCSCHDTSGLELKVSLDNGSSWPITTTIDHSSTHNPSLIPLPNSHLGILYERHHNRHITFQSIDLNTII